MSAWRIVATLLAAWSLVVCAWGASAMPRGVREVPVTIGSGAWAVDGRLTLPAGRRRAAAVVLVPGSVPADMDVRVGGTLLFRELVWGLAARGIASVRFTKRTLQHAAAFDARGRHATLDEEVLDDAADAVRLLRRTPGVDPRRIYVFGHSMGATLAPMIAATQGLAGAIAMAGSPRRTGDMLVEQARYGLSLVTTEQERAEARAVIAAGERLNALTASSEPGETIMGAPIAYWRALDAARPIDHIRQLSARGGRTLLLHGDRDYLVNDADWRAWQAAADIRGVTLRHFARLNHLMQDGEGRMTPAEYSWTRPVAPELLETVAAWIGQGERR